jgi:iron complex outermembrane receptor protein
MSSRPHSSDFVLLRKHTVLILLIWLAFAPSLLAQTERRLTWLQDLTVLDDASLSPTEQQDAIAKIRTEIGNWFKLHPDSSFKLPEAPARPWTAEQTAAQVTLLREIVQSILKGDPDRPFHLGIQEVNVTETVSALSPVANNIDQTEITNRNAVNLSQAITYLPGVSLHRYASRGQAAIFLRGFDVRGVPVYIDGIPIYVPYDGHLDFNRFLTSDISEVQVAKGYSSTLMGPNAMGGAVNLVTREPVKKYEGDLSIGTSSGEGLLSSLRLASRRQYFFAQGGLDWAQGEFYPIAHDFVFNNAQSTYQRVNSYQRDEKYSARLGWKPRAQDEYILSYINQKANLGAPPYAGILPVCLPGTSQYCDKAKFWKWPVWNKESYYFLSNTRLGESSSLKLRAYFDHYPTETLMYDDETYSTMTNGNTGNLWYDDHSAGLSSEFSTHIVPWNSLGVSFFFKDDTHRERGTSAGGSTAPLPWIADRDQITSIGIQDGINIHSRLRLTAGFSADHQNGLQAQRLTTQVSPFTCQEFPSGNSFSNCTAHFWSYNPAVLFTYSLAASDTVYATFSAKSRFATIKERYSGRFGLATPNPDLGPEHARNWTFGYSHAFASRTVVQADFFRSDVRDAIENATISNCNNQCNIFVNTGKEQREGLEVAVRSTLIPRLTLDANYSFLNRAIEGSPAVLWVKSVFTSIQPAYATGTPKHKVVGTATARLYRQSLLVTTLRYEAGVLYQNDGGNNSTPLPPLSAPKFATLDLGGIVPIRAGMSLQAGVRNLFDRYYWYQEGYPEEGRNWYFNIRYRF